MTSAPGPASAISVSRELDRVMRADRGRLVSVLATGLRDLALAEEVLQEAAISALTHWGRSGQACPRRFRIAVCGTRPA